MYMALGTHRSLLHTVCLLVVFLRYLGLRISLNRLWFQLALLLSSKFCTAALLRELQWPLSVQGTKDSINITLIFGLRSSA